ncbi:malate dehydrogenase [Aureococcus anophagefferens]|nr:malate dehydrogenase [Aureococcus anophagefferens]
MSHAVATNTMMRLPASELMTMREEFEAEEDGLTLDQFVRVMLRRARHTSKRKYEKLARAKRMARRHAPADEEPAPTFESDDSDVDESDEVYDARGAIRPMVGLDGRANLGAVDDLCELFDQIDVNGDQHLEWEEFTSFVIEHGMEKSDDDRGGLHDRYLERKLRLLCICAAGCWALFSPFPRAAAARDHVRAVFQCSLAPAEETSATAEEVDGSQLLAQSQALLEGGGDDDGDDAREQPSTSTNPDAAPRSTVKDAVIECLDVVFAPKDELIIALCSDLTLRFYHMSSRQSVHEETVNAKGRDAPRAAPHARGLASGGAFGADDGDVLPREVGLLATASMDRTIKLWELPAMVCVSTLEGHSAGVRSLSYDRAQHVLLSAGFEFGVRAWGVSGHQAFPLFALEGGHATSVRSVCAAPGGSRSAVSLDDDGVLAWWDTSRDSASSASNRLTHAVTLSGDDCAVVVPVGFGVDVEMAQHKQREAARARSLELDKLAQRRQSLLDAKGGGSPLRPPTSGPRFESESLETEREALDAATASAAIAYSTNAISLACGGKRGVLRLLDANDHRDAEAPPTLVAYSPLTHEIVTAHGGAIKCWDVQMGLLKKEHSLGDGPRAADVSGLSFDARGRRLLVADRWRRRHPPRRDAALMSLGQHRAEVAGLVYAPQDRVVVTVGWDRCLHVYDEREENPDDALLRAVANAHAADITGVALSRDAGLIATCDATGGMKLWDFLDLGLVAEVRDGAWKLLPQATAMAFLEPYPLLVVCDGASGVHVVPTLKNTAPKDAKTQERRVALRFENGKSAFADGGFRRRGG